MSRVFSWEYFSFLQIDDSIMSKVLESSLTIFMMPYLAPGIYAFPGICGLSGIGSCLAVAAARQMWFRPWINTGGSIV